jgi:hypothetical protein
MTVTVGQSPASIQLVIYRGDDFAFALDVQDTDGNPVDLTGATVTAEVRAQPGAIDVLTTFDTTIDGSAITLRLSHTDTAALSTAGGVWDVQVTRADGVVVTLANGQVRVFADVTRPAATSDEQR